MAKIRPIWELEDEYIDRRIAGETIDIYDYCNESELDNGEKEELKWRLLSYEASQKGLKKSVREHINLETLKVKMLAATELRKAELIAVAQHCDQGIIDELATVRVEFKNYQGEFVIGKDMDSVALQLRKGHHIPEELEGKLLEIYVNSEKKGTFRVDGGEAIIIFSKLGISIQEYPKIDRYVIKNGKTIMDEGKMK